MAGRRRKVSKFVDPDADETNCAECGDTIDIADEESVGDAIVRHFKAAGHFSD
ncbi:hypothetical protein [Haloglomus salinum]|uniref:hypothetical protein n=1 Tax=Haloglomus salinum TaxID=2962673 RepID=UPI0020C972A6|nr:hypothetical protein [Haloglomus salinum]